jgi:hypothetical protein
MNGEINYEAVLADLEARRAALDTAIASIRQILGLTSITSGAPASAAAPGDVTSIASDAFFSMSVIEAAKKYLGLKKRPAATREIADALIAGGFITQSANFFNTVFSGLDRESKRESPEIVKIGNDWGLAGWYPGRTFRNKRSAKPDEPLAGEAFDRAITKALTDPTE